MKDKKDNPFFDTLDSIYFKNGESFNEKKTPIYVISLWLSYDRELLGIVDMINPYHYLLQPETIYKYYYDKIPKGKRFIKWAKKTEQDKKREKLIEDISEEYGISKLEAAKFV
jgi:hypothetical protein